MRELQARRGFLALFDRASGQLGLKVCEGIPSETCRKYAGALPTGFTRTLAQRGKPVAISGSLPAKLMEIADPDELENLLAFPGLLAAPLRLKERVVGVIVLSGAQSGQPYGENELNFLVQLSQHVALALEKAGVIHQLKRGKAVSSAPT
jgi:GAF domain-containing protein